MEVLGVEIPIGKEIVIHLKVANLPTRTEINIPVFIYRAEQPGPSVLFSAGMHGDEINGVEIIRQILDNNINHVDKGMVVCIPVINVYGFLYFSRYVPDGKDINRSFPGSRRGSLASKIAWNIMNHILPLVDIGIDFHTGGEQRENFPQIRADFSDEGMLDLVKKTHAPFLINSPIINRSFRKWANKKGKKIIVFEGGESKRFSSEIISEGLSCAKYFLFEHGMLSEPPKHRNESIVIAEKKWYRSPASGMWVSEVLSGDFVLNGQRMGYITSPYGDFCENVISKKEGIVLGLNNQAVVNSGDALINLGSVS